MKSRISLSLNRLAGVVILFTMIAYADGCTKSNSMYTTDGGGGSKGGPGTNEVWIQGFAFTPASITVAAGTRITWTNKDSASHTVTSDDGTFTSSGTLGNGATYSYTFTTAGTYNYHCAIHTYMTAKVIVN